MGKPRGARSLADQLADFEDPTPKGMKECFIYGSLVGIIHAYLLHRF
jgi:hypothetical protein